MLKVQGSRFKVQGWKQITTVSSSEMPVGILYRELLIGSEQLAVSNASLG